MDTTRKVLFLLLMTAVITTTVILGEDTEDWTKHCNRCKCLWSNGRKIADCKSLQLTEIPKNLSSEIRTVELSHNHLYELRSHAFTMVRMPDVQKLKLNNCSLTFVHKNALKGLQQLIELDLSKNAIKSLDQTIFADNIRLRILDLSNNKLEELQNGLFKDLKFLQRVEVNNNALKFVGVNAFENVPSLLYFHLGNNQIKHMDANIIESLDKLSSLDLHGNPWLCDCHLKKFKELTTNSGKNLLTAPTLCAEPERLRNRSWSDLESREFACAPDILLPSTDTRFQASADSNYTLSCKVKGDPIPDINWVSNGRILDSDPRKQQNAQRYSIAKDRYGETIWSNLTIIHVRYHDRGEYKCVAKNPGGVDERNVTVVVLGDMDGGAVSSLMTPWTLIIILLISVLLLFLVICLLYCCYCRRTSRRHISKSDAHGSNGDISLNDGRVPEMEKSLITVVNPVVKPPRQYSVPPSVTSGATEVSEVNRTLLDNDSVFAGDDESRSFDFVEPTPVKRSQNYLDVDYTSRSGSVSGGGDNHRPYPPDLLSFPPRAMQVSPAGSSASTAPDHSRLPPPHGPTSPLHSPLYENPALYRTLPYSRSQSPFTSPLGGPGLPVVTARPGSYVTIPRRPRASWSAAPPGTPLAAEPVYDNLGLRTTATGSSVLSLNRLDAGTPKQGRAGLLPDPSPKAAKPGPMTPIFIEPIVEQDSPPTAATLPRSRTISPATEPRRGSWTRPPLSDDTFREPQSEGRITKIPPRPPPKPKKKASTGPLFEDEGEDGTEV